MNLPEWVGGAALMGSVAAAFNFGLWMGLDPIVALGEGISSFLGFVSVIVVVAVVVARRQGK